MYDGSKIKYLNSCEKEALFDAIRNDTSRHKIRNLAIFTLAEYCGLRASEVGLITLDDLDIYKNEIYVNRLKKSRNNTLRIVDNTTLIPLNDYLDFRKYSNITTKILFPSQKGNPISRKTLDELMKKYCKIAGIAKDKSHFHALKHCRAVWLADIDLDTREIQYWLGHKSVKNTEIYLQFTSRQQETLYKKVESCIK